MNNNAPLSAGKKIKIYILSVILCPLGVYWFFKYFKNPEAGNRKVAYVSLVITLITGMLSFYITYTYIQTLLDFTDSYKQQLELYSELGY